MSANFSYTKGIVADNLAVLIMDGRSNFSPQMHQAESSTMHKKAICGRSGSNRWKGH